MTELARRSRLFIGSYAVLFLLLALRFTTPWLRIVCAGIAAVGFLDMVQIVVRVSAKTGVDPITVATVSDEGPEVAGYLASYLLPFLTVAEPSGWDIAAYTIFLFVTGLIYVRSEMTQINPTLYLFGRRVVHVVTDGHWDGHVIARSLLQPGSAIQTVSLNSAVRVEVRSAEEVP
jgi:hypothetical protein